MSNDKEPFYYDEKMFRHDVGDLKGPEIDLLAKYYPTYWQKNWRMTLLEGIKEGWDNYKIFCNKIRDKKIDVKTDQSEGGHAAMIPHKIQRAAFRLLYLRYRQAGKTPTQARKEIRKNHFPNVKTDTLLKNTVPNLYDEQKP